MIEAQTGQLDAAVPGSKVGTRTRCTGGGEDPYYPSPVLNESSYAFACIPMFSVGHLPGVWSLKTVYALVGDELPTGSGSPGHG